MCFDLIGVRCSRGIKRLYNQRHALVGGSPAGEDPTLGSHADEFTNYQRLALSVQPSVIQNNILLYVGNRLCYPPNVGSWDSLELVCLVFLFKMKNSFISVAYFTMLRATFRGLTVVITKKKDKISRLTKKINQQLF